MQTTTQKILIIGVNYNSYNYIPEFLSSIDVAASNVSTCQVTVAIADNTTDSIQSILTNYSNIQVKVYPYHQNLGYLGGALSIYNELQQGFDYVAIANIDLTIQADFFSQLLRIAPQQTGWLAPDIYTPRTHTHENPNMATRPNKMKFLIWFAIYSVPLLYQIYHSLYKIRHNSPIHTSTSNTIYCGHGSFMLFTSRFTAYYPHLEYPCFMYGEEIYLGELTRQAKLQVQYCPLLRITNIGNASVSALPSKQVFNWRKQSLKYLYSAFFA